MGFKSLIVSTCAYALITATFTSYAATILVYTGNSYDTFSQPSSYDTSMSVSLTLELYSPLEANYRGTPSIRSFSITDGISEYDANDGGFNWWVTLETDAEAEIIGWWIEVSDFYPYGVAVGDHMYSIITTTWDHQFYRNYDPLDVAEEWTCTAVDPHEYTPKCTEAELTSSASVAWSPGNWAVIPVPTAIWLFGSGLIGLIGIARRKRA